MNAKTNLLWVCNHAFKLLSVAALTIVAAGLLGFAAQSKSLAALHTGQPAPAYALEWHLGAGAWLYNRMLRGATRKSVWHRSMPGMQTPLRFRAH